MKISPGPSYHVDFDAHLVRGRFRPDAHQFAGHPREGGSLCGRAKVQPGQFRLDAPRAGHAALLLPDPVGDRPHQAVRRSSRRQDAPHWPDDEKSWEEIKARLQKGIDYLGTFKPEQFDGTEQKLITLKTRHGEQQLTAEDYLLKNAMPNFYFHVTTAYDLLRHAGVPIGKRDFTGL